METLNLQKVASWPRVKSRNSALRMSDGALPSPRRLLHFVELTIFVLLAFSFSQGQQSRPTESQVKAAYLFNFGKFVRWPGVLSTSDESLQICVVGKNPFGSVLEATVKGEVIDGRKVTARTLSTIQEAAGCRILFVSASEEGRLAGIFSAAQRLGVLTVSDIPNFVARGGMIGFVNQNERIRFEVNAAPLADAGLTVSSELLKVAIRVIPKGGGEN